MPVIPAVTAYYGTETQLLIQAATRRETISLANGVQQIAVNGTDIAIRDNDNNVSVYDTIRMVWQEWPLTCTDIAWHEAERQLWCVAYDNLYLADADTVTLTAIAPPQSQYVRVLIRPHTAEVWAIQTSHDRRQLCRILPSTDCRYDADMALWAPDGQTLAVGVAQSLQLFDVNGNPLASGAPTPMQSVFWLNNTTLFVATPHDTYVYHVPTQHITPYTTQIPSRDLLAVH